MVEYQKRTSSGVSKAALATAIGAGVVALSNGGGLGNILPAVGVGARSPYVAPAAAPLVFPADPNGGYVTEKEMCLIRENSSQGAVIAQLTAEKYTDNQISLALAPVYGELSKQKDDICDIKAALAMEIERRSCGDENLLTYVNGNFIKAEKSLNSCHINYHGVKPVIRPNDDCCECGCNHGERR